MADEKKSVGSIPAETDLEPGTAVHEQSWYQRVTSRKNDIDELGREMLRRSMQYDENQLERDSARVLRKLDFIVLPMVGSPTAQVSSPPSANYAYRW